MARHAWSLETFNSRVPCSTLTSDAGRGIDARGREKITQYRGEQWHCESLGPLRLEVVILGEERELLSSTAGLDARRQRDLTLYGLIEGPLNI